MAGLKGSIKSDNLSTKLSTKTIAVSIGGNTVLMTDHSKLNNLDWANSGHIGFAGIEFGTTAEWNARPTYTPSKGMIVVYTDYETTTDPQTGQPITYANFKIGTGNAYVGDLQFTSDSIKADLVNHINDVSVHIQEGERARWNNKLNYEEPEGDLLTFTRN